MPDVSVIVPNWNGADRLPALFRSLRLQDGIAQVIVVDNGSLDRSLEICRDANASVIALPENRGFSAAVNAGIRAATESWLAILNNDVELAPGWLATLRSAAEARSAWFATGKLLDSRTRSRIDGTYDALCRGATAWRCGAGRLDGPAFQSETGIQFAPFTAVLVRKDLFNQVGLLDEDFESYLEDVEFGLRCARHGLGGVYVPNAVGYHQGSATLGRWHSDTVRRLSRNQLLLVAKHYPENWFFRHGWPVLVAQALWGLVALRYGCGFAWLKGKIEGLRLFYKVRRVAQGLFPLDPILRRSETQIRLIQSKTGFDWYWRLYFALT